MQKGFTLIELMVSVTIFAIVMVISLGALLSISAAERKAETLKSVTDNLNFALDSMSRTLRTGIDYVCPAPASVPNPPVPSNCPSGATVIAFKAVDNSLPECTGGGITACIVKYCLGDASTNTCGSGSSILRAVNNGTPVPITSPDVRISNLMFYVQGACSATASNCTTDRIQPKITITLNGTIAVTSAQSTTFNLQTSVTQRLYDQ